MTEHGIKELERQLQQAESRLADARFAERTALHRLRSAKRDKAVADMAAQGITPGTKVIAPGKGWRGEEIQSEPGIYMGFEFSRYDTDPAIDVRKITKSGKPHAFQNLRFNCLGSVQWSAAE